MTTQERLEMMTNPGPHLLKGGAVRQLRFSIRSLMLAVAIVGLLAALGVWLVGLQAERPIPPWKRSLKQLHFSPFSNPTPGPDVERPESMPNGDDAFAAGR
jgi:hypothetical protein